MWGEKSISVNSNRDGNMAFYFHFSRSRVHIHFYFCGIGMECYSTSEVFLEGKCEKRFLLPPLRWVRVHFIYNTIPMYVWRGGNKWNGSVYPFAQAFYGICHCRSNSIQLHQVSSKFSLIAYAALFIALLDGFRWTMVKIHSQVDWAIHLNRTMMMTTSIVHFPDCTRFNCQFC